MRQVFLQIIFLNLYPALVNLCERHLLMQVKDSSRQEFRATFWYPKIMKLVNPHHDFSNKSIQQQCPALPHELSFHILFLITNWNTTMQYNAILFPHFYQILYIWIWWMTLTLYSWVWFWHDVNNQKLWYDIR